MRKLSLFITLATMLFFAAGLQAQQFDAAFGFGTVTAPSASTNSSGISFPSLSGGLYPSFSGNVLFWHHLGVGGNVAWRARQALYPVGFGAVVPYRPLFYDFNAVYGHNFSKKVGGDVMAGIGGEDTRFYTGINCGTISCTNYQSSNHVAFHVGADLRYYVWGHLFVRPEAHYYVIHNNVEFNNVNASRFAVSIGYSFMPGF